MILLFSKGFLTVGIPSIRRPSTDTVYLIQTLQSLINHTSHEDKQALTIVVLLADLNQTYNEELGRTLNTKLRKHLDDGFVRVIKPPREIYPNFDNIKKTYNDGGDRLKWRAKQNIDFAYLLLYSQNISDFYIQLEDDVLCATNFTQSIRSELQGMGRTEKWFMLEFSRLGFIGKLFKSKDLPWISNYLLQHFDEKPGDLLLGKMLHANGQRKPIHSNFSLFQHNGKFSSLKNKLMPSIDAYFKDADNIDLPIMQIPTGDNPPASLLTTFEGVPGYPLTAVYDNNATSFYWAKGLRKNDMLLLTLEGPANFSRIIISTGDARRKKDSLMFSALFTAPSRFDRHRNEENRCGFFSKLADFIDGEIDTKAMGIQIPLDLLCLKILLRKDSKTWVIFRDIVLQY